jgi:hypothetical protein
MLLLNRYHYYTAMSALAITRSAILIALFLLSFFIASALAMEQGIFSGRVTDVTGAPIAGAEIFVYRGSNTRRPADFISPPTDKDGAFRMTLPVDNYLAVARVRESSARFGPLMPGDRHSGEPLPISVATGSSMREDFVVASLREAALLMKKTDAGHFSLQGRLLGKEDQPIANAYVFAHGSEMITGVPDFLSPWTGANGAFIIFLPKGEYYLGYSMEFPPASSHTVENKILIDRDLENFDIVRE